MSPMTLFLQQDRQARSVRRLVDGFADDGKAGANPVGFAVALPIRMTRLVVHKTSPVPKRNVGWVLPRTRAVGGWNGDLSSASWFKHAPQFVHRVNLVRQVLDYVVSFDEFRRVGGPWPRVAQVRHLDALTRLHVDIHKAGQNSVTTSKVEFHKRRLLRRSSFGLRRCSA